MPLDHPDAKWVLGVAEALDTWLDSPSPLTTSQIKGSGAIEIAEAKLSARFDGRPVQLMPSATYALWVALRVLGVGPGDEVLIPRCDWTSSYAAVTALGAIPVIVPVDARTMTIDPAEAAARRTARTRAVIATHLFGIPADVPEIQKVLPRIPVIEDCAQAFGSTLDGHPVGTLGALAVFSFAAGKRIDVGELGALVLRDRDLARQALALSAHPIRQQLAGFAALDPTGLSIRPHPLAAILLSVALDRDNAMAVVAARRELAARVLLASDVLPLGLDSRRGVASPIIPCDPDDDVHEALLPAGVGCSHSSVLDIESIASGWPTSLRVPVLSAVSRLTLVGGQTARRLRSGNTVRTLERR